MKTTRRIGVLGLVAVVLVAASCVTPPPPAPSVPPPTLPTGVGVRWIRDVGGTNDPVSGAYTPDWQRYVTLDGSTTGPVPAGFDSLPPLLWDLGLGGFFNGGLRPDGTAKFPWNGFAGEGMTTAAVGLSVELSFPGGTCSVGGGFDITVDSAIPSPDGTKVAVLQRHNNLLAMYEVTIRELVDGGCPPLSSEEYFFDQLDLEGDTLEGRFVWAADSSGVVYVVTHRTAAQTTSHSVDRLDVGSSGASDLLPPSQDVTVPLGWSVADRLLVSESESSAGVVRLVTMGLDGSARRVIDVATQSVNIPNLFATVASSYGYFVPGTTSIVYNDATSVTNSDGHTVPWFQVRLITDAPGAISGPLTGTAPPLVWHQENTNPPGSSDPPVYTDIPNPDLVERFTRP